MKSRNKDHKTHESIIGKIIYGFLLFMPLLAIGVTCAVNLWNANNETETTINQIPVYYESNEINTNDDLLIGNIYKYTDNVDPTLMPYADFRITIKKDLFLEQYTQYKTYNIVFIDIYLSRSGNNVSVYYLMRWIDANDTSRTQYINIDAVESYFIIENITNTANIPSYFLSKVTYTDYKYVKSYTEQQVVTYEKNDIFYYSIDKVQQSPLFNWAEDSAIYTGMTATCNTLNITTPFIPLLMTYWLIISVIYILYDIILVILHIFHKKIHQLEDSF